MSKLEFKEFDYLITNSKNATNQVENIVLKN